MPDPAPRAPHTTACQVRTEAFENYGTHHAKCILTRWSAGEPTPEGGYRMKYGNRWYQVRPVDETPKCECGLAEAFLLPCYCPRLAELKEAIQTAEAMLHPGMASVKMREVWKVLHGVRHDPS